jgi:hypothetical protein
MDQHISLFQLFLDELVTLRKVLSYILRRVVVDADDFMGYSCWRTNFQLASDRQDGRYAIFPQYFFFCGLKTAEKESAFA